MRRGLTRKGGLGGWNGRQIQVAHSLETLAGLRYHTDEHAMNSPPAVDDEEHNNQRRNTITRTRGANGLNREERSAAGEDNSRTNTQQTTRPRRGEKGHEANEGWENGRTTADRRQHDGRFTHGARTAKTSFFQTQRPTRANTHTSTPPSLGRRTGTNGTQAKADHTRLSKDSIQETNETKTHWDSQVRDDGPVGDDSLQAPPSAPTEERIFFSMENIQESRRWAVGLTLFMLGPPAPPHVTSISPEPPAPQY
ncbi:hypothetical protein MMC07_001955 [Pseudocyphellaria aurata]|nr:hypothetical protein [Pseudocyphellaria aurata]